MCSKKIPFTSAERELVVALVQERPIIEDKRTHAKNIELKKQAWVELTDAFNSNAYVSKRSTIQLKRCWENLKSQRKKEIGQESKNMKGTGGGPPEGGSGPSDNIVDVICPFINLKVPGVIDSNSIKIMREVKNLSNQNLDEEEKSENIMDLDHNHTKRNIATELLFGNDNEVYNIDLNSSRMDEVDENVPPPLKRNYKEISTPNNKKRLLITESEARVKRCSLNINHDEALHELRMKREETLIAREKNLLEYEKTIHNLQIEKLKLEIELLKKKND